MTTQQIKANAPSNWHIGKYASIIFYITVIIFLALGFVLGIIFYPIIYP